MNALTDLWDARKTVLNYAFPTLSETVSLEQGMGKILARKILSPVDLPHFNRSRMDGYCINANISDFNKPFKIKGEISASDYPENTLESNEALKVATGSMIPENADMVVPLEYSKNHNGKIFLEKTEKRFINVKGSKVKQNEKIFPAKHRLDHRDLELLASLKISHIEVLMPPMIGVISTGGEITHLFHSKHSIVNSNFYMLTALLNKLNIPHSYLGVVPDSKNELAKVLKTSSERYDIITTFGGTGFSRFDLLTSTIRELGGRILIEGINASPGKTFKFAELNDKPIFIFPGTPESAVVSTEFFLIPFVKKIMAPDSEDFHTQKSAVNFDLKKKEGFYKLIQTYTYFENDSLYSTDRYSAKVPGSLSSFRSISVVDKSEREIQKGEKCDTLLTYYL